MDNILGKLFGSNYRLRLLRLFLFNPESAFDNKEISKRSKVPLRNLRSELNLFKKIGLISTGKITKNRGFGKPGAISYHLNTQFPLTYNLKALVNADFLRERTDISKKFKNCGQIKLMVVSGIFLQNDDTRIDLFIAGEKLKRSKIDNVIKNIESLVGKELTYSVLDLKEFVYRYNSNDKFIRDIFDYPHERLIDKILTA